MGQFRLRLRLVKDRVVLHGTVNRRLAQWLQLASFRLATLALSNLRWHLFVWIGLLVSSLGSLIAIFAFLFTISRGCAPQAHRCLDYAVAWTTIIVRVCDLCVAVFVLESRARCFYIQRSSLRRRLLLLELRLSLRLVVLLRSIQILKEFLFIIRLFVFRFLQNWRFLIALLHSN